MSIGDTEVDFKEIYDAINGDGAHDLSGNPAIGMDYFYGKSFTDGTSTPASGPIGIGDMIGKTVETTDQTYPLQFHPPATTAGSGKTGTQINISNPNSNPIITSNINSSRTEAYFTSVTQIYDNTSIKFQSVKNPGNNTDNLMFGIGNGTFTRMTNAADPRIDIHSGFYLYGSGFNLKNSGYNGGTSLSYTSNTLFEIRIIGGYCSFFIDGVLKWDPQTNQVDFSTPKYLMGTMYFQNSGVKNITIENIMPDNLTAVIPTPTVANVSGSNRYSENVMPFGEFINSAYGAHTEHSTLKGGIGANKYINYYLCNLIMYHLPDRDINRVTDIYGASSLTYTGMYDDMGFYIRDNSLRPISGYAFYVGNGGVFTGNTQSIFLPGASGSWIVANGPTSKGLCVTFLDEDKRPSLILDCGENKWVSGIVIGGAAIYPGGVQAWRHFTMKYGEDNFSNWEDNNNWTNIVPSASNIIDTDSKSAYNDWNANENTTYGAPKYAAKTTEFDRMFQFNDSSTTNTSWGLVSENILFAQPVYGRYFKFTLFSWAWSALIFADLILNVPPPISSPSSPDSLYDFTSHTFTNCTATGQNGPTLENCTSSYSSSTWTSNPNNYFNMTTQGIQEWTVPTGGSYRIQVWGAQGGQSGGYGAYKRGDFILTQGDIIHILIGQTGGTNGGGGGGTFVIKSPYNSVSSVLIIAGGGGGGYGAAGGGTYIYTRGNGGESGSGGYQSGTYNGTHSGKGGSNGGGGGAGSASDNSPLGGGAGGNGVDGGNTTGTSSNAGAGGGGLLGKGGNSYNYVRKGGNSFILGGHGGGSGAGSGGFGGGGEAASGRGGGGGYSGGGGGSWTGGWTHAYGGGGGSYNAGTTPIMETGNRVGHGQVTIEKL
jgi:hypothetical protein